MTISLSLSSSSRKVNHCQLYLPKPGSTDNVVAMLKKPGLTVENVHDHLKGNWLTLKPKSRDEQRFMQRRKEIVELAAQIQSGDAQIDANYRLVPHRGRDPLPEIPPQAAAGMNNNPLAPPLLVGALDLLENEDVERQMLEREQRDASEAIARAVKRYRDQGVPEEDFIFVAIPPVRRHDTVNLTFRRICFAVLAVVTAFICIMLQTLPLFTAVKPADAVFDKLMPELLHVRDFLHHARYCRNLHRNRDSFRNIVAGNASAIDCSDGVLHIPAAHVLKNRDDRLALNTEEAAILEPYSNGVNVSWTMPCKKNSDDEVDGEDGACSYKHDVCFRGVHDGWIPGNDVAHAIHLGINLIVEGGDHFEIHDNVEILRARLPHLVLQVRNLLVNQYNLSHLEPVAFRVNVALPMDGADVSGGRRQELLGYTINKTNYINWMENAKRHNMEALYSLYGTKPQRDTCNLLSDKDGNKSYAVHTSIFLSDGAGKDFQGGVALYVDEDNTNRRMRVRRGVSIDGSTGRVIVSTGGLENRRCRLPIRAGIRAVLQIWWNEPSCLTSSVNEDLSASEHRQEL